MKKPLVNRYVFVCLFMFLFACDNDDGDVQPNLDTVGFDIDVSGSTSRNMQGSNATYRFLDMPSSFVTSHQLAMYLTDGDGYTVIATILLNGTTLPGTGTYEVNDIFNSNGLELFDAGLSFGQNGGISHNTIGGSGTITITETGSGFIKGTLDGSLRATSNGGGEVSLKGSFYAEE
ncbi:MAG: hypothetical protein AAFR66_00380 [Bacteroidota bacterium]